MGQYKVFINYSFTKFLIGFDYQKNFSFCLHLLWFKFGIGLTKGAKGFGFWKEN